MNSDEEYDPRDKDSGRLDFSKVRPKEFPKRKRDEDDGNSSDEEDDEDFHENRSLKRARGGSVKSMGRKSTSGVSTGGKSHVSKFSQASKRSNKSGFALTGKEFKSKKGAGGDTQGKQKLEPYAYWPMDPKLLNRRHVKNTAARKGLKKVVAKARFSTESIKVNPTLRCIFSSGEAH